MSPSIPTNPETAAGGRPARKGRLKILLGYAAGVGKTYRMLEEGQQLKRQGADVVIGYFEPHARKDTIAKAEGLEVVPRRTVSYRGGTFQEMDTDAIVARHPAVCLVDELAHSNVPGSQYSKRWEDVHALLATGIDVFTTLNIQHLESLNDQVFEISGIRVRETVPDWVVKQAEEVVMVDATTGALLNRLKRGVVYDPEKAQRAVENFFKESTLAALRELALRHTARELELREEESARISEVPRFEPQPALASAAPATRARDRILIHITADPSTAMLIRRGRRVADYLDADCVAVYVSHHRDLSGLPSAERQAVEQHLNFARNLQIETRVLEGDDRAQAIADFAHRNQVTQILLSRTRDGWLAGLFGRSLPLQVIRKAWDIRVTVVADRRPPGLNSPLL